MILGLRWAQDQRCRSSKNAPQSGRRIKSEVNHPVGKPPSVSPGIPRAMRPELLEKQRARLLRAALKLTPDGLKDSGMLRKLHEFKLVEAWKAGRQRIHALKAERTAREAEVARKQVKRGEKRGAEELDGAVDPAAESRSWSRSPSPSPAGSAERELQTLMQRGRPSPPAEDPAQAYRSAEKLDSPRSSRRRVRGFFS